MTKLPVVSGEKAIKALIKADFIVIRQRGSHVRLKKATFENFIRRITKVNPVRTVDT